MQKQDIGKLLRKYRQKHKLTQEEIAGLLEISIRNLRSWEYGKSFPNLENYHDVLFKLGLEK